MRMHFCLRRSLFRMNFLYLKLLRNIGISNRCRRPNEFAVVQFWGPSKWWKCILIFRIHCSLQDSLLIHTRTLVQVKLFTADHDDALLRLGPSHLFPYADEWEHSPFRFCTPLPLFIIRGKSSREHLRLFKILLFRQGQFFLTFSQPILDIHNLCYLWPEMLSVMPPITLYYGSIILCRIVCSVLRG